MAIAEPVDAQAADAQCAASARRRQTSFAGDVLKLVSGTTIAQALGVLVTPLLTRLYAPEAFGTLALFTSITSIIGVVACLRYELAIMLPESDEEAANLLAVSLASVVLVAALTLSLASFGASLMVRLLKAPELGPYLWLVPPAVLFGGVFQALNYWNSRTKQFGRLSVVRVISSASTNAVKLGAGVAGHATGGTLVGASVLGPAVSVLELGRRIWRDDGALLRRAIRCDDMLRGLRRHKRFPLYSTWGALLNSISWQLPAFLLSHYFSSAVVGQYSLGNRVLQVPMSLIGAAISQVFFQRAAVAKAEGVLARTVESGFRYLVAFGMFPLLLLMLVGHDVFVVLLGERWAEAGVYAQILSVWTFVWFISSPLSTLFSVLERQDLALANNLIIFGTRLLALLLGGLLGDARIALFLFAVSGVLAYGHVCLRVVTLSGVCIGNVAGTLWRWLLAFLPAAAVVALLRLAAAPREIVFVVSCVLLFAYYTLLVLTDNTLRAFCRRLW